MSNEGYEGTATPQRDSAPGDYDDRDAYEKIARHMALDGGPGLPVTRSGEANEATNGFRPSNEPEGCSREPHGDHPATFSGGPRPSHGADPEWPGAEMRPSSSRGQVASEEFAEGTRITGGRSDL